MFEIFAPDTELVHYRVQPLAFTIDIVIAVILPPVFHAYIGNIIIIIIFIDKQAATTRGFCIEEKRFLPGISSDERADATLGLCSLKKQTLIVG